MKILYFCQVEPYGYPPVEERDAFLQLKFHLPNQGWIVA